MNQELGLTLDEIESLRKKRMEDSGSGGFQWKYEYLPFAIAFVGILSLPLISKMTKKFKKPRRKK